MSFQKEARTAFANRTIMVSDLFNFHFRDVVLTGAVNRVVSVTPQTTQSTGGGRQAREAIVLKPQSENAGGSNVVIGFLDIGGSLAELRLFEDLKSRHHQRFGSLPFDLNEQEIQAFIDRAKPFLEGEGFQVTLVQPAAAPSAAPATGQVSPDEETSTQLRAPAEPKKPRPVRNLQGRDDERTSLGPYAFVFMLGMLAGVLLTYLAMR